MTMKMGVPLRARVRRAIRAILGKGGRQPRPPLFGCVLLIWGD